MSDHPDIVVYRRNDHEVIVDTGYSVQVYPAHCNVTVLPFRGSGAVFLADRFRGIPAPICGHCRGEWDYSHRCGSVQP